jgi:hypothetical protein
VPLPRIVRSASEGAERLLDRLLCVLGAVLFSQGPEFMQQYLQRLEGHLDEARLVLSRFQAAAAQAGLTLDQLVANAHQNADPGMGKLALVVAQTKGRVDQLGATDAALRGASVFSRPFVFLGHLDPEIARSTLAIYRPAVPTTGEGLVYALTGVVVILALYHLLVRGPVVRVLRRRETARRAAAA